MVSFVFVWGLLCLGALALQPSDSNPASVTIEAVEFPHVSVHLRNELAETLTFLTWGTPFHRFVAARSLFAVSDITQEPPTHVEYAGRLAAFAGATSSSFVTIPPGGEAVADVDLSELFRFEEGHTYAVTLAQLRLRFVLGNDLNLGAAHLEQLATVVMSCTSPKCSLIGTAPETTEAPINKARRVADVEETMSEAVDRRRFTFQNCDTTEQSQINLAVPNALAGVDNALAYLAQCQGYDYELMFGAFSTSRLASVVRALNNTRRLLFNRNFKMYCNPADCEPDVYAYVYPSDTAQHTIHVCGAFWPISETLELDSKPGTIVHEMTHFNDIGQTDDHQYGYKGCIELAQTSPALAVDNADSFEFFTEGGKACCDSAAPCEVCIQTNGCRSCNATGSAGCGRTVEQCGDSDPSVWNTCAAAGSCAAAADCGACVALSGCGWCESQRACVAGSSSGPSDGSFCPTWGWSTCSGFGSTQCGGARSCTECAYSFQCGWCDATGTCEPGSVEGSTETGCTGEGWAFTPTLCGGGSAAAPVAAAVFGMLFLLLALL